VRTATDVDVSTIAHLDFPVPCESLVLPPSCPNEASWRLVQRCTGCDDWHFVLCDECKAKMIQRALSGVRTGECQTCQGPVVDEWERL
jgi:hypothetical protein